MKRFIKALLAPLGLFLCLPVLADTWYVRPGVTPAGVDVNFGAEDGSSYAAAFDEFGDITWGVGGVVAGDTLKVCGTFFQNSANTANGNLAMMQVAESGSDGLPIIIDGNCSAEGDLAVAVLDGDYTSGSVIRTRDETYITLRNLDLSGASDSGLTLYLATTETAVAKHINVESSVTVHDIHGGSGNKIGINVTGTHVDIGDYSTTGNKIQIYDIGTDGIFYYSGGDSTIDGANIYEISEDDSNGDCVQIQRDADLTYVKDLRCDKTNKDSKQCVVISTLDAQTHVVEVDDMTCLMSGGDVSVGVYAEGQTTVRRSYIKDAGHYSLVAALNDDADLTAIGNILDGATDGCIDGHKTSAGGTVIAYNNTMHNCGLAAFDFADATASHIVKNNSITGAGTFGIYRGASGTADSYNNVSGPDTAYCDNGIAGEESLGAKAEAVPFVGGADPAGDINAYRLRAGSTLRRVGQELGPMQDHGNRAFLHPPSIGAWEAASGDAATTRTAR